MTGIAFPGDVKEHGKGLQMFKEVVPTATRIVVLYDDRHPASTISIRELRRVAYHLGVELSYLPVKSISDAERAVSSIKESEVEGVFPICTSLFADPTKPATVAKRIKMPFHSCNTDHVIRGTIPFTYARDYYSIGRRGAWYVDQILTGAKPHQLPVEIPLSMTLLLIFRQPNRSVSLYPGGC